MNAQQWAIIAATLVTVLTATAAVLKFIIKSYLMELKPNGGSSLRDSVNINSKRLERLEERVDSIYEILCTRD
jgi:hypothetical protein